MRRTRLRSWSSAHAATVRRARHLGDVVHSNVRLGQDVEDFDDPDPEPVDGPEELEALEDESDELFDAPPPLDSFDPDSFEPDFFEPGSFDPDSFEPVVRDPVSESFAVLPSPPDEPPRLSVR